MQTSSMEESDRPSLLHSWERWLSTLSEVWRHSPLSPLLLTQHVGWHAQEGVHQVMDFPVPLDHIRQLFIINELGRHPGIRRNLL